MSGTTSNNEPRESASRRHSSHNPTHSPIHTRASEHMTWYYTEQGLCMALSNAIQARGRSSPQSSSLSEAASRRRLATVEATLQPDSTAKLLAPPHCKPAPDHTGYRSALVTSAARLRRSRADFSYLAISASTTSGARDSSSSSNDTPPAWLEGSKALAHFKAARPSCRASRPLPNRPARRGARPWEASGQPVSTVGGGRPWAARGLAPGTACSNRQSALIDEA